MSNQFEDQVKQKRSRSVHTFKFPAAVQKEFGIQSVGICELTPEEELMACERAKVNPLRYGYEKTLQSLVEVDGKPVGLADGSADTAWKNLHPKVREMVLSAHAKVHAAEEDATKLFLESQTVLST